MSATTGAAAMVAAAMLVASPAPAQHRAPSCAASPKRVGPCFSVHGRLAVWNGAPAFRIRPQAAKRMLGVNSPSGDPALDADIPAAVRRARTTSATTVEGDWRVCPLSRARPGRMQFVCIDSAANLVPREP